MRVNISILLILSRLDIVVTLSSNQQVFQFHCYVISLDSFVSHVIIFQMFATTAIGYLTAWGPFALLCIWEMVTEPIVSINPFKAVASLLYVSGNSRRISLYSFSVLQVCDCIQPFYLFLPFQGF